jgi:hypothetical protein
LVYIIQSLPGSFLSLPSLFLAYSNHYSLLLLNISFYSFDICVWLISLNTVTYSSIYFVESDRISFFMGERGEWYTMYTHTHVCVCLCVQMDNLTSSFSIWISSNCSSCILLWLRLPELHWIAVVLHQITDESLSVFPHSVQCYL